MPHRAQRRRNREAREALDTQEASKVSFLDWAEKELDMRRDFVAEAVRSSGLVSLTFRPLGVPGHLNVYGGAITFDGTSRLWGDSLVNNWTLPNIYGFQIKFDQDPAAITNLDPAFRSLDVSDTWQRTVDELIDPRISFEQEGRSDRIVITREGLPVLIENIGNRVLGESLRYVEGQLFPS